MIRKLRAALAALTLTLALLAGVGSPAWAACGDTAAEWVDPTLGSAWSGTLDTSAMTVVLTPALNLAATVVITQSGAGTWVHDYDTRWTASAAGIWDYHFEVTASSCSGGKVTAASGGATDALNVVHSVSMTRTL